MSDGVSKAPASAKSKNGAPAENTRSAGLKQGPVDPQVLEAIKIAMQPVLDAQASIAASQNDMSRKLDNALSELASVSNKVEALETAAQASSDRMDTVVSDALPAIADRISSVATALAMRQMDLEVHRRKWALVIQGVEGAAKEKEEDTRAACIALARDALKVPNGMNTRVSACHRLSQDADAGIIIRFTDLTERNLWLQHTKNLKGKDTKVTIYPDLPPVLRKLKTDVLAQRKELDPTIRKQSFVKYIKQWPYVRLSIRGQTDRNPRIAQETIVKDILGVHPHVELQEGL